MIIILQTLLHLLVEVMDLQDGFGFKITFQYPSMQVFLLTIEEDEEVPSEFIAEILANCQFGKSIRGLILLMTAR